MIDLRDRFNVDNDYFMNKNS